MFTAELHHLDTYISQPITLKHGVINEKIANIHHSKNLHSCMYSFPLQQNKMTAAEKKPYMIIYISTLK